jgi:hypothetical protein
MAMKGKIILSIVLAATMVGILVLGSDMIASYLERLSYTPLAYAADALVIDTGPGIRAFINKTLTAGGGYWATDFEPYVVLDFSNGETGGGIGPDFTISGMLNGTKDRMPTKIYYSLCGDLGVYGAQSDEFKNCTTLGLFSWYGNYSEGREIRSVLTVNDNETIDLGISKLSNVLFGFNLGQNSSGDDVMTFPGMNNERVPEELWQVWDMSGLWTTSMSPGHAWEITYAQLMNLTTDARALGSGFASILFEGSVWLTGNYSVTSKGVTKNGTTNVTKNVLFGRIDFTFSKDGILTLSYRFDRIDIALCVRPEE